MYQSGRQPSTDCNTQSDLVETKQTKSFVENYKNKNKRGEPNLGRLGDGKYLSYPYNPSIVVARRISWRKRRRMGICPCDCVIS